MVRQARGRGWIIAALGDAALFERLASEMTGSELWSVLLEVARERARARTPADLLSQYLRDAFVRPAAADQRAFVELDAQLLSAAARFEALELSPVAPLGACSALAVTDQHRVLSALRGVEVVSDPTNVLALECAGRLRRQPAATVRLATSQRVLRTQPSPKGPGYGQHFRMFALATAGRETKDHAFTAAAVAEHVRAMMDALDRLEGIGYAFGPRRVDVLATAERAALGDRVAESLRPYTVARKPLEHPYYSGGLRYMLWGTTAQGRDVPFIDGGVFDWLARLTANRKNVFVASGAGTQLIAAQFRARAGES